MVLAEQLLLNSGQLRFELLIERAKLRVDAAAAGRYRFIGNNSHGSRARQLLGNRLGMRRKRGGVIGMQPENDFRVARGQLERFANPLQLDLRAAAELATADAGGNRGGQLNGVLFPVLLPRLARMSDA